MKFVNHKANFVSLELVSKSRNPRINQLLKFPSTSQIVKSFQKDKGLLRSTLIVELMKAQDSIEWKFMISCLLAIGAPKVCALHRSVYNFFQVFNRLVYLESVYFNKTENFLFKILQIKAKINGHSTIEPINSTTKCSRPINSSKNKLNGKIN